MTRKEAAKFSKSRTGYASIVQIENEWYMFTTMSDVQGAHRVSWGTGPEGQFQIALKGGRWVRA